MNLFFKKCYFFDIRFFDCKHISSLKKNYKKDKSQDQISEQV